MIYKAYQSSASGEREDEDQPNKMPNKLTLAALDWLVELPQCFRATPPECGHYFLASPAHQASLSS